MNTDASKPIPFFSEIHWRQLRADIWRRIKRWFDRERELIALRHACYMMSEARRSDAVELDSMEQNCRALTRGHTSALLAIRDERRRQIEVEGFNSTHDAEHSIGELERAGACYALSAAADRRLYAESPPPFWPWSDAWWKPKAPRQDLVRAGALILAAIEKIDLREQLAADLKAHASHAPRRKK